MSWIQRSSRVAAGVGGADGGRSLVAAAGDQAQEQSDHARDRAAPPSRSRHLDASRAQPCYTSGEGEIMLRRVTTGATTGSSGGRALRGLADRVVPGGAPGARRRDPGDGRPRGAARDQGRRARGRRHGLRAGPGPEARRPAARARDRDQGLPGLRGQPQRRVHGHDGRRDPARQGEGRGHRHRLHPQHGREADDADDARRDHRRARQHAPRPGRAAAHGERARRDAALARRAADRRPPPQPDQLLDRRRRPGRPRVRRRHGPALARPDARRQRRARRRAHRVVLSDYRDVPWPPGA